MYERVAQLAARAVDYHMLVDFDVGHRRVLVFQPAFETSAAFAKE